jgi:rubredoxin
LYTIISTLILFLIVIFSILLYFKLKTQNLKSLHNGTCPSCGATKKEFVNPTNAMTIKVDVILIKVLRDGGCSNTTELEYKCKECGFKLISSEYKGYC